MILYVFAAQDKAERRHHPVFPIASVAESGTPYASDNNARRLGVPHWRLALGNMAAGGSAGALVEAGDLLAGSTHEKADEMHRVCLSYAGPTALAITHDIVSGKS